MIYCIILYKTMYKYYYLQQEIDALIINFSMIADDPKLNMKIEQ